MPSVTISHGGQMRTFHLVSSFAALLASAPLVAQGRPSGTVLNPGSGTILNPGSGTILNPDRIPRTRDDRRDSRDRIPPGQLPPAGMCRIWIDGVSPGQQPAPTDCQTAVANKPANARIIWGDQQSFPGKGKGKFKSQNRDQTGVLNGRRHGHGDDEDDDRDDDRGMNSRQSGSAQFPAIGEVNRSSPELSHRPNKGKKHGE
jgi:hypothetical protein